MRKSITVPKQIDVEVRGETRQITFDKLMAQWLADPVWGQTLDAGEMRREVRLKWEAFKKEHGEEIEGKSFVLTVREHGALAQVVRKPSPTRPYEPEVIDRAIDMLYAVTEAKSVGD